MNSTLRLEGGVTSRVTRTREWGVDNRDLPTRWREWLGLAWPHTHLEPRVREIRNRTFPSVVRGLWKRLLAEQLGMSFLSGVDTMRIKDVRGRVLDVGLTSTRLVTSAFMEELINELDDGAATAFTQYRFHGFGTGSTAVANSDTDLDTELTTQYNPNSTRPTGTHIQPAANQYRSVGTVTVDVGATINEHGMFNNATVGSGTLLDRHLTGAVALLATESMEITYTLTASPET